MPAASDGIHGPDGGLTGYPGETGHFDCVRRVCLNAVSGIRRRIDRSGIDEKGSQTDANSLHQ
jgi:hypothetical protein